MFVVTALVYPGVLALLCLGAGLAVDRAAGSFLPGVLLPAVGLAALITLSELATYVSGVAPATPYLAVAFAASGFALGWSRVQTIARRWREHHWQLAVPVVAYVVAGAPVLFAGRPTFSAYMVLTDSALHMQGADFLLRHGQHYAHLDLLNSYGQYIDRYYNSNYPTGSDGLLGATAFLLHVPVIWAFQPFNAFVLATVCGPAWLLARRLGLDGVWAAAAALVAAVPALVYAYELIGSIKEITALALILAVGALVAVHPRWLRGAPRAAIPFALVVAAGVSALGVAFGAWTLVAVVALAGVVIADHGAARRDVWRLLTLFGFGTIVLLIGSWPTWHHVSGSVQVAQAVASSANPGNLTLPLQTIQVFGSWLQGSYQQSPSGSSLAITYALIAVTALAGLLGAAHIMRTRQYALAAWLALMVVVGLVLTRVGGTWAGAKTLVLTSPVFIVLAWGGVAALRVAAAKRGRVERVLPVLVAVLLAGGVLGSDLVQYHDANLAPTARYQELASLDARFAGRGPTLFTDFDDYVLYELRDLDVGAPDSLYPPIGLVGVDVEHGLAVRLIRAHASALSAYPLIVTRRDPSVARPPFAYRLLWQGVYYQVWGRFPDAPPAIARIALSGARAVRCSRVQTLASVAAAHGAQLAAASPVELVKLDLGASHRPASWRHVGTWYVMPVPGRLETAFRVPHAGGWNVWLQGEIMRAVTVRVDGHLVGSIGGQVGGDLFVPNTMTPLLAHLSAGPHLLSITRGGASLAPGDGGSAILTSLFLAPAGPGEQAQIHVAAPTRWRSLCGHPYVWIEATRLPGRGAGG